MLSKLRLGARIILSFSLIIVFLLIISGKSIYESNKSEDVLSATSSVELPNLTGASLLGTNNILQTSYIRAYLLYEKEEYYQNYLNVSNETAKIAVDILASLRQNNKDGVNDALISQAEMAQALDLQYSAIAEQKLRPLMQAGQLEQAKEVAANDLAPLANEKTSNANKLFADSVELIQGNLADNIADAETTAIIVIVLSVAIIIASILIAMLLTRTITKPTNILVAGARNIAGGDLIQAVNINRQDEIGDIANAFNSMREKLNSTVKSIIDISLVIAAAQEELSASSQEMSASSEYIARAVDDLAKGATTQAQASENTTKMIDSISSNIEIIAQNASNAEESSRQTLSFAENGVQQAAYSVETINEISAISEQTTIAINELGEQSRQIGDIVDVIKGIADQTNLLALNAAIEAARAGDQGRGFAVVAEEVRKLAELSSESTQQITEVISSMQSKTKLAVDSMDKSSKAVANGVKAVVEAGSAFTTIKEAVSEIVAQSASSINSLREVTSATQSAVDEMGNIAAISEEAAANTEQISATTQQQSAASQTLVDTVQDMVAKGVALRELVSVFKI
ncbi:MAG: methyl-accepting chemotaxis protein [Peptococcaceae bacterium]|jgi:methyl-accepting chemotaxis protein|nr:methyl-accepting chemotaxis protein [Peptococcaceae bacterium]